MFSGTETLFQAYMPESLSVYQLVQQIILLFCINTASVITLDNKNYNNTVNITKSIWGWLNALSEQS